MTLTKITTSINRNGAVYFAKIPSRPNEFMVWFRANERCTEHRSVAYRLRGFKVANRKFNRLADQTEC